MAKQDKYEVLVDSIVDLAGGKVNISHFAHCITRLRFNVKDKGLIKMDAIKNLPGVMGAQWSGDQLQVIIGNDVEKVYQRICDKHGFGAEAKIMEDLDHKKKKFSFGAMLDALTGCIIPLTPVIMGYGLIQVLLLVLDMTHILPSDSQTYFVLDFVARACLYFLPIYVGATAAKKFGANASLGMLMGGMLLYPTFVSAVSAGDAMVVFGIPIYAVSYANTFFSTILAVYAMSHVERFIRKYTPSFLSTVVVPLGVILIMTPLNLCLIGPLGSYIGTYVSEAMIWIYETIGFVGVVLISVLKPLLVMTGMHTGFTPYVINAYTVVGYEPFYAVGTTISNVMQGIASLAVAVKTKKGEIKSEAIGAAVPALTTGVIEPAMYGINLRYKKPMIAAMIGSGAAGLYAGLTHVASYAMTNGGLLGVVGYVTENSANIINTVIALVIGTVVTFVVTLVTFKDEAE